MRETLSSPIAYHVDHRRSALVITPLVLTLITISMASIPLLMDGSYLYTVVSVLSAIIILWFMAYRLHLETVSFVLTAVSLTTCVHAIIQYVVGIAPLSWTGNINFIGYIAAILFHLSIRSKQYYLIVLSIIAMLVSNCTGAYLCSLGCLLVLLRNRPIPFITVMFISIFVMMLNGLSSITNRLDIWRSIGYPALFGPTSVYFSHGALHAHNAILQSMITFGIVPTVAICLFSAWWLAILSRNSNDGLIAAIYIVITSSIDYLYWWPGLSFIVIAYLVWSARVNIDDSNNAAINCFVRS